MTDPGAQIRLDALKREADRHMIEPLRNHGWEVSIEQATPGSDLMILSASRAGSVRRLALIYSSATDNNVYRSLAERVDQIYFQGQPYHLEQFARGIEPQPKSLAEFGADLLTWNRETSPGKFSPVDDKDAHASSRRPDYIRLLSENPIDAIWLRLRQLQSRTLAEKLVRYRAQRVDVALDESAMKAKAEGIAFALRNAGDYFSVADKKNISQRVLNLYYGAMAFASAEMLAAPRGASALSEIERSTVQGHGLHTVPGQDGSLGAIAVTPFGQGFFPEWLKVVGIRAPAYPEKRPKKIEDLAHLDESAKITIEELFGSIPELSDLFIDIFESAPRTALLIHDSEANPGLGGMGTPSRDRTYGNVVDASARMTKEDVARFLGPISEIQAVESRYSGRVFRIGVDHPGLRSWGDALEAHDSPLTKRSLIRPIFGNIVEFRMICVVLLYALSIVVRYRPSLWRRVQEGDLDQFRVLIEAFLGVVERVLPEEFLAKITAQQVLANQPGSLFG